MKAPEIPANEAQRLQALERYDILDTPPEQVFDDLTALACHICGTRIALVSIVDEHRQWFKSKVGLDAEQTPRDVSFCGHVVHSGELLHVSDSHRDERFTDNPLVTGAPFVRFYAGAPLRTPDGHVLGTLCVIDEEAMALNEHQLEMLRALARQVVSQLELRRSARLSKQAADEIQLARLAAEQANQSKSAFLANMSHELRTPLNSIIGFTNILAKNRRGVLGERDLDFLGRIGKNGRHLLSLINDVLDISKIEAGHLDLEMTSIPLAAVVADAVAAVEGSSPVPIDVSCASDIPANADRRRLTQVLINLIANAVKFSDGHPVSVAVEHDAAGPYRINVVDRGIGIASDKLATIFAPFEQADATTARQYGGTGLGLAISRALCRSMGFELQVASVLGQGSTFSVRLRVDAPPLKYSGVSTNEQHAALGGIRDPVTMHPVDRALRTLLVVDDDSDARMVMQRYAEDLGFRVVAVDSAQRGLEVARAIQPDAISLDLMMPDVDGFEFMRRLSADAVLRDIPLIVSSNVGGEHRIQLANRVELLDKPVDRDQLEGVLERVLQSDRPLVLIVDDDPDARTLLREVVAERGCRVSIAGNGAEALARVMKDPPDLVVLDLMMPVVDGFGFLRQMRSLPMAKSIPVVLCTAKDLTSRDLVELNGTVDHLVQKGADTANGVREQLAKILGVPT